MRRILKWSLILIIVVVALTAVKFLWLIGQQILLDRRCPPPTEDDVIAVYDLAAKQAEPDNPAPTEQYAGRQKVKLLFLGIDALSYNYLKPALEKNKMPNLKRILQQGAQGPLDINVRPLLSPVLWWTIATGVPPEMHGIHHFLTNPSGPSTIYTTLHRKYKAVWNILSEHGIRSGVYGYIVSWPAEQIEGVYVSSMGMGVHFCRSEDATRFRSQFYPPRIEHAIKALPGFRRLAECPPLIMQEGFEDVFKRGDAAGKKSGGKSEQEITERKFTELKTLSPEELERANKGIKNPLRLLLFPLKFIIGGDKEKAADRTLLGVYLRDRFYVEVAKNIAPDNPLDAVFFYWDNIDLASHFFYGNEEKVLAYYELTDGLIGEVLKLYDPEIIVICSDHGFSANEAIEVAMSSIFTPGVKHLPPLIGDHYPMATIIISGGGIGRRLIEADIYDLAPFILELFGIPPSKEMKESYLYTNIFNRPTPTGEPYSSAFGKRELPEALKSPKVTPEMREMLKSLGYI